MNSSEMQIIKRVMRSNGSCDVYDLHVFDHLDAVQITMSLEQLVNAGILSYRRPNISLNMDPIDLVVYLRYALGGAKKPWREIPSKWVASTIDPSEVPIQSLKNFLRIMGPSHLAE